MYKTSLNRLDSMSTLQARTVGFPQSSNLRKCCTQTACPLIAESDLDLLLECSNWESLHNSPGWLCLHLNLLSECHPCASFCGCLCPCLIRQMPGTVKTPFFF